MKSTLLINSHSFEYFPDAKPYPVLLAQSRSHKDITREQVRFLTKQNCHYCGVEPRQVSHIPQGNGDCIYTGIDRVDNSRRYEFGNVVPCCGDCNYAKRKKTVDEFKAWGRRFYNHFVKEP